METLTSLGLIALAGGVGYGVCTQDEYAARCQQLAGDAESRINDLLEPYKPWQVSLLSMLALVIVYKVYSFLFCHEDSLLTRTKTAIFALARKIPFVQGQIDKEIVKAKRGFEVSMLEKHKAPASIASMPFKGKPWSELEGLLKEYAGVGDPQQRQDDGKVSGTIYVGDENFAEYTTMLTKTYSMFAWTNPLHPGVFPGVRQMEAEVVRMCCDIFGGGPEACGSISSGGTESIMLACKSYRDYYRQAKGITKPNMVCCVTAHPAFDKSCHFLGIKLIKLPMLSNCKADVRAIARYMNSNTIAIVGSCPQYPHGAVDPIEELAVLAKSRGVGLHVDCCLGSFVVPFMRKAGFDFPAFDFSVDGVTSISADTHKFGFAPKGSSVVLYSKKELVHAQYSMFPDWPGGVYGTPTIAGSRSGALVASTWAALVYHGEEGYIRTTKKVIDTLNVIHAGMLKIPGIKLMCEPEGPIISWTSDVFDIYRMTAGMVEERGWDLNVLQFPPSIHLCVTLAHTKPGVAETFLKDLSEVAAPLYATPKVKAEGGAAVYGMAQSIPDRSIIEDVVRSYLDTTYAIKAD